MEKPLSPLEQILRIGFVTSIRGDGISLRDAIAATYYKDMRTSFSPIDLIPFIQSNPAYVRDWLMYSEDKRTSGGWYLLEHSVVGQVTSEVRLQYPSIEVAVAEYVVRELDFWAGIDG
jgi:hypothetical protein